ncbi:MAG: adenylate/guanylate cyclase domain-containing protein [Simkaniaceae bacterium]|nr:adenylate/guanylate cyclase domain-containing protein [Simkaniaceae bacterium]
MSTVVSLLIICGEAGHLILHEVRGKVLAVVWGAVQLLDADVVESVIRTRGDPEGPAFRTLKEKLIGIRKVSQHTDIYVNEIYLVQWDPVAKRYRYVIDPGEEGHPGHGYGEYVSQRLRPPERSLVPYVNRNVHLKTGGNWITGFAPVSNRGGDPIALLGISIGMEEVYHETGQLILYGCIAFIVSIGVGLIFAYFLADFVTSSLSTLCDTVRGIGRGNYASRAVLHTGDEFNELSIAINGMAKGLEEREKLKVTFARYVSQYPVGNLLNEGRLLSEEAERKRVTILFSDIRNFTSMAERLPPEEVLRLLNEYFTAMIEVIFQYGGTLDKFTGDGLMVEFGAPVEDRLQEFHAVLAALHMQRKLKGLRDGWRGEGRETFSMGIGIHSGLAVLGNIGSERRMEYTAIGDTVNIASRLERLTKFVGQSILISKPVYDKVKNYIVCENLSERQIPGRVGNIRVFAVDPDKQRDLRQVELTHEMQQVLDDEE